MTPNRNILVAVCGTTGVGKTKLALKIASSLACNYGGAVCLNGDSMQVYKGSDIATNKPTKEEMSVCDQLLFDFVDV
jgi:tRNA dimethylallyltransferase